MHAIRLAAMFAMVWALPNTQQIMMRFAPTISKFEAGPERFWNWQPTVRWGIAIALLFMVTLTGRLGNPAKFLYFQF